MSAELEITTRCVKCDNCRLICPEGAVNIHDQEFLIESWSCTLCGLCIEVCPTEAIQLSIREDEI